MWRPVLRVPISCRSHRRLMMSVVMDRPIFARFLTAGGECSFLILLWYLARVLFDLYSWTVFIGFLSGLACRPTDSFIVRFLAWFFEGRQSWLGGLVSLAWWLGLFWFLSSVLNNCESVYLLVTRLGLMPCSAWSKKKWQGQEGHL